MLYQLCLFSYFSLNLGVWRTNLITNGLLWAVKKFQFYRSDKHVGSGCATVTLVLQRLKVSKSGL